MDSRIVSFLFQIDSVEELVFDQILFMELLELKERLTLNKKTNIYKVRNGFTFIGYRFFIKKRRLVIRITNKVKVRIKRKIKNLSIYDQEKLMRVKASYYGYLKRASTGFLQFSFKIKGKN